MRGKLTLTVLVSSLMSISGALEVGTNCLAITCESMEGKCCDRSDLELKVTLSDNCSKCWIHSNPIIGASAKFKGSFLD